MLTVLYRVLGVWSPSGWNAEIALSDLSETVVPFIQGSLFETAILSGVIISWSSVPSNMRSLSTSINGSWMICLAVHSE